MAFEIPKINYTGKIKEVTIGTGEHAVNGWGSKLLPVSPF